LESIRISIEGILICSAFQLGQNFKIVKAGAKNKNSAFYPSMLWGREAGYTFLNVFGRQILLNLFNQTLKLKVQCFHLPLLTFDGQRRV